MQKWAILAFFLHKSLHDHQSTRWGQTWTVQLSVFSGDPAPVLESRGAMNTEIVCGWLITFPLVDWLNTCTFRDEEERCNEWFFDIICSYYDKTVLINLTVHTVLVKVVQEVCLLTLVHAENRCAKFYQTEMTILSESLNDPNQQCWASFISISASTTTYIL